MANGNQPVNLTERLTEASIKEMEKQTKEQTKSRMQQGQPPEAILGQLLQSVNPPAAQQEATTRETISRLAAEPVAQEGTTLGLIPMLLQAAQGKGFRNPLGPRYAPRGEESAVKLIDAQRKLAQERRETVTSSMEILSGLLDLYKQTGNREGMQTVQKVMQGMTGQQTAPGGQPIGTADNQPPKMPGYRDTVTINGVDLGEVGEGTGLIRDANNNIVPEYDILTGEPTFTAKMRMQQFEQTMKGALEAGIKQKVDISQKEANLGRVVSALELAMSQLKGGIEEKAAGSLMKGIWGDIKIFLQRPGVGRAASYDAQINETALSLNNILTGQNRVIKGVVQMIKSTFPTRKAPPDRIGNLMAQSVKNAYNIYKAFEKAGITPEELSKLNTSRTVDLGDGVTADEIDLRDMGISLNDILEVRGKSVLLKNMTLTPYEIRERAALVQRVLNAPVAESETITQDKVIQKQSDEINALDMEIQALEQDLGISGGQ